jgi:hypothetical protein
MRRWMGSGPSAGRTSRNTGIPQLRTLCRRRTLSQSGACAHIRRWSGCTHRSYKVVVVTVPQGPRHTHAVLAGVVQRAGIAFVTGRAVRHRLAGAGRRVTPPALRAGHILGRQRLRHQRHSLRAARRRARQRRLGAGSRRAWRTGARDWANAVDGQRCQERPRRAASPAKGEEKEKGPMIHRDEDERQVRRSRLTSEAKAWGWAYSARSTQADGDGGAAACLRLPKLSRRP